jgi:hypothetical protein
MALKPCKGCKKEVDTTAKACPNCGRPSPTASGCGQVVGAVLAVVLFFVIYSVLTSGVEKSVATDFVKQYEIAKKRGGAMDACVQAGVVAAAYLQAKDENEFKKWKAIERTDCARAGVAIE